jgi:membrane protease YdiL (CAAX protease family)
MSFTVRFAAVLVGAVAAAVALSPVAAAALAAFGFHLPFPRIFDRIVIAALLLAILWNARAFKLRRRLARGFAQPFANLTPALGGLAVAIAAIAVLWMLAATIIDGAATVVVLSRAAAYLPAAILIAVIEEGFFRAFLLAGMESDFGRRGAIVASSAVYALAHLVRSPARFYLTGLEPAAGARNLVAALGQLAAPHIAVPAIVGLFLVGLILGAGFVQSGTVYFSIGLHAGLIVGLKSWMVTDRAALPQWLFGFGRFPLVSGAAAWAVAIVVLALVRLLSRRNRTV